MFYSPKLKAGRAWAGIGNFTVAPVAAGELLITWGGVIMPAADLFRQDDRIRANSLQVGPDSFLVPEKLSDMDFVNHSCDPNCGILGTCSLVALRAIPEGKEITFDYAMTDSTDYDEFICCCASDVCRGRITGEDWRRPELQRAYAGRFSDYLRAKIESQINS